MRLGEGLGRAQQAATADGGRDGGGACLQAVQGAGTGLGRHDAACGEGAKRQIWQ
jgi:hypothetical protein